MTNLLLEIERKFNKKEKTVSTQETGFWSLASLRGESKPRIKRSRTIGSSPLPFEMAN